MMEQTSSAHSRHQSVLCEEILQSFAGADDRALCFDGTLGGAGHAEALLEAFPKGFLVGFDRDREALERAERRLQRFADRTWLAHSSFADLDKTLAECPEHIRQKMSEASIASDQSVRFDRMLLDLGISSDQLDEAERGFSFSSEGPLDMRMNRTDGQTAADILNHSSESDLFRIFRAGGVTQGVSALVREILNVRPIYTTKEFADLCVRVFRSGKLLRQARSAHHPATVPFQALRIAVNGEFDAIRDFLSQALAHLAPAGRLAIISFHSSEDKLVAHTMRAWSRADAESRHLPEATPVEGELITKKAVVPTEAEIEHNPRARSARLRIFEKRT